MPSLASWKWDEFVADADDLRDRLSAALGEGDPDPSALGRAGVVALVTAWEVYIRTLALEVVSLGVGEDCGALGSLRAVEDLAGPDDPAVQTPKLAFTRKLLLTALGDSDDDPLAGLAPDDLDAAVQLRHDIVHLRWDDHRRPDTRKLKVTEDELGRYIARLRGLVERLEINLEQLLSSRLGFAPWI